MVSVKNKAEYVKNQPQNGDHECHWPGCQTQVPPAIWGCKKHWFKLPPLLRSKIWSCYRPGQELDKRPSASYLEVAKQVQEWIKTNG